MQYSKRLTTILTVLIVVVCNLLGGCSKKPDVLRIGAILPLTGDAAVWGKNSSEGMELAKDLQNRLRKDFKIEILYEDSEANPSKGVSAFNKLTTVNGIKVIIGDIASSVNLAIDPLSEKNNIVVLSPGATSPKLSGIGKYFFRNWNSDDFEAKVSAKFLSEKLKVSSICIFYINNDYGKGLETAMEKEFSHFGRKIVVAESFQQNDVDFRAQISKLSKLNPEAIYLAGYPTEIQVIIRQAKELGIKCPLIGTAAFEDPQILEIVNRTKLSVYFPLPLPPDSTKSEVKQFQSEFRKKYGKSPGIICDTGYDAVNMIVAAYDSTKKFTGEGIRQGLTMLKDFEGASGVMTFDANGDVSKPMGMRTVTNDKFGWVEF